MNPYKARSWVIFSIVLVILLSAAVSGCSTIDGVGKDISSTAQWTKEKMGGSK